MNTNVDKNVSSFSFSLYKKAPYYISCVGVAQFVAVFPAVFADVFVHVFVNAAVNYPM